MLEGKIAHICKLALVQDPQYSGLYLFLHLDYLALLDVADRLIAGEQVESVSVEAVELLPVAYVFAFDIFADICDWFCEAFAQQMHIITNYAQICFKLDLFKCKRLAIGILLFIY